jgi:serine/threonine protein kinase
MEFTVQNVCGLLIRSKLLSPDEVKVMYQRWLGEAGAAAGDLGQFTKWLVAKHYVTEYQANLVAKGHADDFFLGQYKILDRIGRGRMAGVYKAIHQLGQVVAIKVLPPSRSKDPHLLARFVRESRLALRLKHPNVVRAFQVGQANGLHYLVMEYLEGETLDEVLQRRRRLPPTEAVRLIHQALLGLEHIHDEGLVHRDLKPSNLMLVHGGAGTPETTVTATVKILDIGLGRVLFEEGAAAPENLQLTSEGVILGTPDYMSPEQARDPRAADIRADIYSLGGVLYHALTGQPPFPDTNVISQMVRHATETPRPLKEFNPTVPDGLQQILNWMLAKDPAQRYPTPQRAAQALQVFLVAGSAPARALEAEPQMRKFLTWLETDNGSKEAPAAPAAPARALAAKEPAAPPAAIPVSPKAASARPAAPPKPAEPPAPARVPAAPKTDPAVPTRVPRRQAPTAPQGPSRKRAAKKDRRHRAASPPAAIPAPIPLSADDFDVELVPAMLPPAATSAGEGGRLSRRDWILLGVGAGAGVVAIGVGILIRLLSGSDEAEETE